MYTPFRQQFINCHVNIYDSIDTMYTVRQLCAYFNACSFYESVYNTELMLLLLKSIQFKHIVDVL